MLELVTPPAMSGTPVTAIKLPNELAHLIGVQFGSPAPGQRVSVDTPLDQSQRDYNENDVKRYIKEVQGVDWNLFGYVTAVEYPDGSRYIINGQHRTGVVKTLLPQVTEVPAHIIKTNDPRYAAVLFARYNGVTSRQVSKEDLLKAEIIAGIPSALNTLHWLQQCNVSCGQVNLPDPTSNITAVSVKRATFERAIKLSPEATVFAINLIRDSYPEATSFDNLLLGLVRLLSLPEYEKLMNKNITIGREFTNWFMNVLPLVFKINGLTTIVTRTDPWLNSIAYGLYKQFRIYMNNIDKLHHCPSSDTLKKMYKNKDEEDEV